jgi:hypothetical protein
MAKRISDGTPGDIKGVPCENRLGRQCLDQDLEWPRSRGSVSVNYTRINACRLTRGGRAAVPAPRRVPAVHMAGPLDRSPRLAVFGAPVASAAAAAPPPARVARPYGWTPTWLESAGGPLRN